MTFIFILVLGTSIWVLADGYRYKMDSNESPIIWFIGCLLLWIIAFPWYLAKRSSYKLKTNSEDEKSSKKELKMEHEKKKGISTLGKFGIGCGSLIVLIVIISVVSSYDKLQGDIKNGFAPTSDSTTSSTNSSSPATNESKAPSVPAEYKSALSQAGSYAKTMHMSKQGVYDQLVSEYGGKFSAEAAQYAIDNVKADWGANALAKAKTYQDTMHLSPSAIHDQLTSQFGEKFTQAEADYAIQRLND